MEYTFLCYKLSELVHEGQKNTSATYPIEMMLQSTFKSK